MTCTTLPTLYLALWQLRRVRLLQVEQPVQNVNATRPGELMRLVVYEVPQYRGEKTEVLSRSPEVIAESLLASAVSVLGPTYLLRQKGMLSKRAIEKVVISNPPYTHEDIQRLAKQAVTESVNRSLQGLGFVRVYDGGSPEAGTKQHYLADVVGFNEVLSESIQDSPSVLVCFSHDVEHVYVFHG
jgi:hypothetical protein